MSTPYSGAERREEEMMSKTELRTIYRSYGRNVLTPIVLRTEFIPSINTVIELSEGSGIFCDRLYGVTVLTFDDHGRRIHHDDGLSQVFMDDREQAEQYFERVAMRPDLRRSRVRPA